MTALSDLSQRDRRALMAMAVAILLFLGYRFFFNGTPDAAVAGIDSVPLAERRLNSLRQITATLPAKEAVLKEVEAELASREKAVIVEGTAGQAQAKLLQVARRVSTANGIDVRGGELNLTPKLFGDNYGEVFAGVSFNCRIDQFVNFFADLSREPDMLAPSELTVNLTGDPKNKMLAVRMVISGVVPKKLVPEKKGYGL